MSHHTTASRSDLSITEANLRRFKEYMMLTDRRREPVIEIDNNEEEGCINSLREPPNETQILISSNRHNRTGSVYANYFSNTEQDDMVELL